jgi:glycosyltransferase involved in cell wall biosynthesis
MGGSENVLVNVLERLDERFAPRVLVMENGALADRIAELGVPVAVEHLPGRKAVRWFPWVARRFRRRPDVIHANGGKAAVLAVPAARRLRAPLLWMKHDHMYDGLPSIALAACCDHVVCVSHAMAEQFVGLRSRVSVVYPGASVRDLGDVSQTSPMVVSVGRLDPFKGFDELLRAGALLREQGVPVDVRIAGPRDRIHHENADRLRALADELGFGADHVGWVDDLDALYARARVGVLASRPRGHGAPGEGAPLVLMEAMGAGRPVVSTAQPGIAEVVGDAGTLVKRPVASELAAALRPYLTDPQLAARVGARGRARVAERMTLDRTVADLSALYLRLAGTR